MWEVGSFKPPLPFKVLSWLCHSRFALKSPIWCTPDSEVWKRWEFWTDGKNKTCQCCQPIKAIFSFSFSDIFFFKDKQDRKTGGPDEKLDNIFFFPSLCLCSTLQIKSLLDTKIFSFLQQSSVRMIGYNLNFLLPFALPSLLLYFVLLLKILFHFKLNLMSYSQEPFLILVLFSF